MKGSLGTDLVKAPGSFRSELHNSSIFLILTSFSRTQTWFVIDAIINQNPILKKDNHSTPRHVSFHHYILSRTGVTALKPSQAGPTKLLSNGFQRTVDPILSGIVNASIQSARCVQRTRRDLRWSWVWQAWTVHYLPRTYTWSTVRS